MENFYRHEMKLPHYEFFEYPEERRELFRYSKAIAEYLKNEEIPNLVIVDRSSRPLYVGVKEYFRSKYPDEKIPNIYFINPKGFKAREDLTEWEIEDIIKDCCWKDDMDEGSYKVRSHEEIMKEFQDTYKNLMKDKDQSVLVFDTCIHSGDSLAPVVNAFDDAGFSDLRIGAVNPAPMDSKVSTDFYITRRRPEKGCYPFDHDRMIEKTFSHVYSKRTKRQSRRDRSVRLRKEIKRIMREYLEDKK